MTRRRPSSAGGADAPRGKRAAARRQPRGHPPDRQVARWSRKRLALSAAALLLAALALGAWWWWPRTVPGHRGFDAPDVLLITIDTLRADRLGSYGHAEASTPVLDDLARRGARFEEAIAPVPLTLPSHASILTGVTPLVHGVRDNAGFALGAAPPTLAEALRDAGYETAAFVSGFPLHRRFGLARGFASYDDRFPRGDDPSRPPYVERRADHTIAAATRWLGGQSQGTGRPVFVWLHLFDPHAPYEAPAPHGSRSLVHPYDAEIAFVDRQIGLFLAAWRSARGPRTPVVLVTADHGEGLGEHDEPTHGLFIYDSTIRVPLIVAGPGVPVGRVVKGAVQLIDVAPTLLDLAGRPAMPGTEGRSLREAMTSGHAPDEPAYAESLFGRLGFGWAPLHGWRHRGLMFIEAPRPELYDVTRDPGQLTNLVAQRAHEVGRMRRAVHAALARAPEARPAAAGRDTAERLRSLGYVASAPVGDPSLRDPKDLATLAVRIENAMAIERADPVRAAAEFRAALREDPRNAVARRHLAMALVAGKRFDEATRELRRLVAAGERSVETFTLLGDCHRLSGRFSEALDAFGRAVASDPTAPEGYNGQGKVLTALGRTEEARQAFERAVRLAPDDAEGLEGLADLALARGDMAEASARLETLTARDPGDSGAALKHGVVLVRTGELERAIAIFRQVADREPANVEAVVDLGGALAKAGRPAEAVTHFERALAAGARSPVVLNSLAMARLETGDAAGAAEALQESLRVRPDQPNISELLKQLAGNKQRIR